VEYVQDTNIKVQKNLTMNRKTMNCKPLGGIYTAYTANEGQERIQYKWQVPIYVFPEMKLRGLIISKTEL
jgi:hypothetical protein